MAGWVAPRISAICHCLRSFSFRNCLILLPISFLFRGSMVLLPARLCRIHSNLRENPGSFYRAPRKTTSPPGISGDRVLLFLGNSGDEERPEAGAELVGHFFHEAFAAERAGFLEGLQEFFAGRAGAEMLPQGLVRFRR